MTATESQAIAAMCVWEFVLENRADYDPEFSKYGASEMREKALHIGFKIENAYQIPNINKNFDAPFDWEFVPGIMRHLSAPFDIEPDQISINTAALMFILSEEN